MTTAPSRDVWHRFGPLILVLAMGLGLEIRLGLLETEGLKGDLDQFVGWVHHIATRGLTTLGSGTDAWAGDVRPGDSLASERPRGGRAGVRDW